MSDFLIKVWEYSFNGLIYSVLLLIILTITKVIKKNKNKYLDIGVITLLAVVGLFFLGVLTPIGMAIVGFINGCVIYHGGC